MSDYHSQRPQNGRGAMDYDTGSGASWIWALIILVALVALIAIGSTGGTGDGSSATPSAPAVDGTGTATESTAPATQNIDQ